MAAAGGRKWWRWEREQVHRQVTAVLDDRADAVGIDHVDVESILDCRGKLRQGELLQEPQHADLGARAVLDIGRLQPAAEQRKTFRQSPVLQGAGIVDAARLTLQEG